MNSPLHRLYKTKLLLIAVILTTVGAVLLLLMAWSESVGFWPWLTGIPTAEIGSALLTTGLVAIVFEFLDRQDADERANERLRRTLQEEAPAIRDAVVEGFAFQPGSLTNVASPETLDRVVENCLELRLGDRRLAEEAYSDLRLQVVKSRNRCYDANVSVVLTPWPGGRRAGRDAMFVATIRWEYHVDPTSPTMRFSCVSDEAEYRELLQDPASTTTWQFKATGELDASSKEAFELVTFKLDGKDQRIRRNARNDSQVYTVQLDASATSDRRHKVSYTYRALVHQGGHLLHLDIARPTKGLTVDFFYGGCGIQNVKILDYISSATKPRISQLPASAPSPSTSLSFDGWVWPKGGVALVWALPLRHSQSDTT